jgi:hypothetical protein
VFFGKETFFGRGSKIQIPPKKMQKLTGPSYRIKRFKPEESKENCAWLIIGGTDTGKSILLNHLLWATHERYDVPIAVTSTMDNVKIFKQSMPSRLVFNEGYNPTQVESIVEMGKELTDEGTRRRLLLVMDDICLSSQEQKAKPFVALHTIARHYDTTSMEISQYALNTPTIIRGNKRIVIAMRELNIENRKKLYNSYFGVFPTFAAFDKVFTNATKDYGALVIDKTTGDNSVEGCIRFFRASLSLPPYKIGRPIYHMISEFLDSMAQRNKRKCADGPDPDVLRS